MMWIKHKSMNRYKDLYLSGFMQTLMIFLNYMAIIRCVGSNVMCGFSPHLSQLIIQHEKAC